MAEFASYDRTAPPVNMASAPYATTAPLAADLNPAAYGAVPPAPASGLGTNPFIGTGPPPATNLSSAPYGTTGATYDSRNGGPALGSTAPFGTSHNSSTGSQAQNGLDNAKNTVLSNASSAAEAVKNHPITQSITNGPVAENVKDQHAKTQNELANLAASRTTPSQTAATGQQLTHYHSFFSTLLSWEHPRASAIAFGSTVFFIFAARYLNILRYGFKLTWVTLGVTVLAEILGKTLLSNGLTSQFRPRKYYTVPKETLNSYIGDVHELINFFVIEAQRIVFAENVYASAAAFLGAFISYYLIKIVPFWGLSLIGTSVLFLGPLIYKTNKELIHHHLHKAADVANQQSTQVKQLATHHAARATETTKQYVGDYSAKAQNMIGNVRQRSVSPTASAKPGKTESGLKNESSLKNEKLGNSYKSDDFPVAPKADLLSDSATLPATSKMNLKGDPAAFPAAPTTDFTPSVPAPNTAPSVGASANTLRTERDPLIAS